jgi:FkbM family methyltransferase
MLNVKKYILLFTVYCLLWTGVIFSLTHGERLRFLKTKGFSPKIIYDIGAYKGDWALEMRRIFNSAQFFLFEANDCHRERLQKLGFPFFIALLGDRKELVSFYSINSTGDSIFLEQTKHYKEGSYIEKKIQMTTLEDVVNTHDLPLPDLIKMDVQGAEKVIINGSLSIVCNAHIVILEVAILEFNKSAPLILEMMTLMNDLGYSMLDLAELHYFPTQELFEVDIIFVKKDSPLIKKGILS